MQLLVRNKRISQYSFSHTCNSGLWGKRAAVTILFTSVAERKMVTYTPILRTALQDNSLSTGVLDHTITFLERQNLIISNQRHYKEIFIFHRSVSRRKIEHQNPPSDKLIVTNGDDTQNKIPLQSKYTYIS